MNLSDDETNRKALTECDDLLKWMEKALKEGVVSEEAIGDSMWITQNLSGTDDEEVRR